MPRRGRPPKSKSNDAKEGAIADITLPDSVNESIAIDGWVIPPKVLNGRPNPEHFRVQAAMLNRINTEIMLGVRDCPRGWDPEKHRKGLIWEAENVYGLDAKHLMDARSEAEKAADVLESLHKVPESVLEKMEDEIGAIENSVAMAMEVTLDELRSEIDRRVKNGGLPEYWEGAENWDPIRGKAGKVLSLLGRLRRLQHSASATVTSRVGKNRIEVVADAASLILRQSAYVMRVPKGIISTKRGAMVWNWHHGRMAVSLFLASNNIGIFRDEQNVSGVKFVAYDSHEKTRNDRYQGIVFMVAPGHGKTTIARAFTRNHIRENMETMAVWLHAKDEQGEAEVNNVKVAFDVSQAEGRRWRALYPSMELDAVDDKSGSFRIKLRSRLTHPTLVGKGVMSKGLGVDNTLQIWDDVVAAGDRDSEADRNKRVTYSAATWETRIRGDSGFRVYMGYPHHADDLLSRKRRDAKASRLYQCVIPCPDDRPTWPEMCPAIKVREIKQSDPLTYACNYLMDPNPEDQKVVRKLRYYDPDSAQHAKFLEDIDEIHLSVDPAATRSDHSCDAGIVMIGLGRAEVASSDTEIVYEQQGRVLAAWAIKANQVELVQEIGRIAESQRVDYVHIESHGGTSATADIFRMQYDMEPIIHRPVALGSKKQRLRAVVGMIEAGNPSVPPPILFPGELTEDGKPGPCRDDPVLKKMEAQILQFDTRKDKDLVDAIVQCLRYISEQGIIGAGAGVFSEQVRRRAGVQSPQRLALLDMILRVEAKQPEPSDDMAAFAGSNW